MYVSVCVCWAVCGGVEFVDVVMCLSVVVVACLLPLRVTELLVM